MTTFVELMICKWFCLGTSRLQMYSMSVTCSSDFLIFCYRLFFPLEMTYRWRHDDIRLYNFIIDGNCKLVIHLSVYTNYFKKFPVFKIFFYIVWFYFKTFFCKNYIFYTCFRYYYFQFLYFWMNYHFLLSYF